MRTAVPTIPFRSVPLAPIRIVDRVPSASPAWCLLWLIVPAWWLAVAWWFL